MARLTLTFPEDQYYYTTLLTVRVTDINAANHLGNDSMISMISEARARFLFEFGVPETERDGTGIIVTDLATTYRAEAGLRLLQLQDEPGRRHAGRLPCQVRAGELGRLNVHIKFSG